KQRQNLVACLAIERPGGLVCQNQGRIVDNGTSDGDALLLAPRKLMGPMMLAMPQSDPVKGIVGSAMPFRSANACISERQRDILQRARTRQQRRQLEHEPDFPAPDCRTRVFAEICDIPSS